MRLLPSASVLLGLLLPAVAFAQLQNPQLIPESGMLDGVCNFVTGEIGFACVPVYLGYLIQLVFGVLGGFCLLEIMRAGYEWAFSGFGGDTSKAKSRIRNALMGLAFAVLSFLIVDNVVTVLFAGARP